MFVCPVCQSPLHRQDKSYQCPVGHQFDVAREGYVNLLLANQKRSAEPGDNAAMIRSRRVFLEAGYYAPLRTRIIDILLVYIELQDDRAGRVLDVGCGEGYYLGGLQSQFAPQPLVFAGVDVSKFAIKAAARRYPAIEFAVAGAHRLPVADASVDYLLSIFAPRAWTEFFRVLKPAGKMLIVSPGPRHLWQLKQMIYAEPQLHEAQIDTPDGFTLRYVTSLDYDLLLPDQAATQQLLVMTPFYWHMTQEQQESVANLAWLTTIVDFQIHVFEKIT